VAIRAGISTRQRAAQQAAQDQWLVGSALRRLENDERGGLTARAMADRFRPARARVTRAGWHRARPHKGARGGGGGDVDARRLGCEAKSMLAPQAGSQAHCCSALLEQAVSCIQSNHKIKRMFVINFIPKYIIWHKQKQNIKSYCKASK
jgi:hypothetical protein